MIRLNNSKICKQLLLQVNVLNSNNLLKIIYIQLKFKAKLFFSVGKIRWSKNKTAVPYHEILTKNRIKQAKESELHKHTHIIYIYIHIIIIIIMSRRLRGYP